MKSICYQKIGDLNNLRANLIQCFQLDPSIEQIRYKIFQINYVKSFAIFKNLSLNLLIKVFFLSK